MAGLALGGGLLARSRAAAPRHVMPESKDGNLVVGLCDGKTTAEVPGVKDGETLSRTQAQSVSDRLMAEWRRKNPQVRWEDAPVEVAQVPPLTAPPAQRGGNLENEFRGHEFRIRRTRSGQFRPKRKLPQLNCQLRIFLSKLRQPAQERAQSRAQTTRAPRPEVSQPPPEARVELVSPSQVWSSLPQVAPAEPPPTQAH